MIEGSGVVARGVTVKLPESAMLLSKLVTPYMLEDVQS
jgi:hypothetical protein